MEEVAEGSESKRMYNCRGVLRLDKRGTITQPSLPLTASDCVGVNVMEEVVAVLLPVVILAAAAVAVPCDGVDPQGGGGGGGDCAAAGCGQEVGADIW